MGDDMEKLNDLQEGGVSHVFAWSELSGLCNRGRKRRANLQTFMATGEGHEAANITAEKAGEEAYACSTPNEEEALVEDNLTEVDTERCMGSLESNKRRRPQSIGLQKDGEFGADSVGNMIYELEKLLDYVSSTPKVRDGSASFMRDYLRTLLVKSSNAASVELDRKASKGIAPQASIQELPHEIVRHVFSFLHGRDLANMRLVCKEWNSFACESKFWRELCLRLWPSLETDESAWKLLEQSITLEEPSRWQKIYPTIIQRPQWVCRLQKTGKFICNLNAHQIRGPALGEQGLPETLVVERRFNIQHLPTFVLPEATILYFEPVTPQDRPGFEQFIDYLVKRTRAGLALDDERRFIFVPPCNFSETLGYNGPSLLGVVQNAYPPLQP
eukprot:Plantae.Rhodophyta-Purpureofilum_apyrenoidigerum.ctg6488.p1 GENE.Plantae.Rhodophyta-Purpureofilum_apyrenoidigerum.ctg6488~~Plantae.Rhodophyta-Purpureofilum_apyrenoidigerum.ctg6488.p1  ORF type:complete len:387 (+),score=56.43 Plantae.Rhodophyta-Purpureofilum_apyrenoidigerum.ctg6488:69-1229(+)